MGRARDAAMRFFDNVASRPVPETELIATLNEVASAVSSAMSVEEVLDAIVERAKRVTDTDKAVLVLADHHSERLDFDMMVVRGSREQHAQDWWESRLVVLGERVFESGRPVIERHADQNALLLACPVLVRERPVGLLCAINSAERPFSREQADFLSVLSAFAASAIENAQLAEQSRYVLLASERDRIAREMHDGVVQSLFAVSLGLELCKKQVLRDPVAVSVRLEELQDASEHVDDRAAALHIRSAADEARRARPCRRGRVLGGRGDARDGPFAGDLWWRARCPCCRRPRRHACTG